MKFLAILLSVLLVASCFAPAAEAGHRRILKKLAKGALLAKLLKPKIGLLPLPLPLPLPIPIHIRAEPEPIYIAKYVLLPISSR